jgi:patatin-like phospholipase/acyl hydrolase
MALELKPGEAANLLSLDGGGVKGISTLWVLKTIMDKVKEIEQKDGLNSSDNPRLPVDYFHMAAGTSTGGIIAIMLFRLRMSPDQAISEYMKIGPQVFGTEAKSGPSKFPAQPLLDAIDSVVGTYAKSPEEQKAKGGASLVDNKAKM